MREKLWKEKKIIKREIVRLGKEKKKMKKKMKERVKKKNMYTFATRAEGEIIKDVTADTMVMNTLTILNYDG